MKRYIKNWVPATLIGCAMALTSCVGDLDVKPIDPNKNTTPTPEQLLSKCYADLGLAGQSGPDGDCDIDGLDGGTTGFVRQLFNTNELPTDEAICNWGDPGISEFNFATYGSTHPMANGFYYRLFFGVTVCNQYINTFGSFNATMTAEARFLRALNYFYLMDLYGNVPFTEELRDGVAPQYSRKQLYSYIESELLAIEPTLAAPQPKKSTDAGYGRVDRAAAWLLLARLYLNAEVYTGTPQWQKAADYAQRVMNSPYHLYTGATTNGWTAYQQLFMGNNGFLWHDAVPHGQHLRRRHRGQSEWSHRQQHHRDMGRQPRTQGSGREVLPLGHRASRACERHARRSRRRPRALRR